MIVYEKKSVPVDEVFLPYLTDGRGRTLYQVYQNGQLLLGSGKERKMSTDFLQITEAGEKDE